MILSKAAQYWPLQPNLLENEMTDLEHAKESTRLRSAVTRAKTKARAAGSLADKIAAKSIVRVAENRLREHLLNYYELVRQ